MSGIIGFDEYLKRRQNGESADDIFGTDFTQSKQQADVSSDGGFPSFEEYLKRRKAGETAEDIAKSWTATQTAPAVTAQDPAQAYVDAMTGKTAQAPAQASSAEPFQLVMAKAAADGRTPDSTEIFNPQMTVQKYSALMEELEKAELQAKSGLYAGEFSYMFDEERAAAEQRAQEIRDAIDNMSADVEAAKRAGYKVDERSGARKTLDRILGVDSSKVTGEKTQWGRLLAANYVKGMYQWGDRFWKSADFLLGKPAQDIHDLATITLDSAIETLNTIPGVNIEELGPSDNIITRMRKQMDATVAEQEKMFAPNANSSAAAQIVDQFGTSTVAAIPLALEAFIYAPAKGAELGVEGATQALRYASSLGQAKGVEAIGVMTKEGIRKTLENPQFWTSYLQVAGESYESALDEGLSDIDAGIYALTNGAINALIEVGGADEALGGIQNPFATTVKESMLEEAMEEPLQGITERVLLAPYNNAPIVSFDREDTKAVFNPWTATQEAAGGAVVGGLLGGAQHVVNSAVESAQPYTGDVDELLDRAESGAGTRSAELARQADERQDQGKPLTQRQAARIERALDRETGGWLFPEQTKQTRTAAEDYAQRVMAAEEQEQQQEQTRQQAEAAARTEEERRADNRTEVIGNIVDRVAAKSQVDLSANDRAALASIYDVKQNGAVGEVFARDALEAFKAGQSGQYATAEDARAASREGSVLTAEQYARAYEAGAASESTGAQTVDTSTEEGKATVKAALASLRTHADAAAEAYESWQDVNKYAAAMQIATGFSANGGDVAALVKQAKAGSAVSRLTSKQVQTAQEIGAKMRQEQKQRTQAQAKKLAAIREQAEAILEQENPELGEVNSGIRDVSKYREDTQKELDDVRAEMAAMREAGPDAESTEAYQQAQEREAYLQESIENSDKLLSDLREARKEIRSKIKGIQGKATVETEDGEVGGLKYKAVDMRKLTKTQKAVVRITEIIAKITGLNIHVADFGPGVGGEYLRGEGGELWLNIEAKYNGANISIGSLFHEMTHWMAEDAPEEYDELKQIVCDEFNKDPAAFADIFWERAVTQPKLTPEDVTDEMVANACQKIFMNDAEVQRILREHKKLGERLREFFLRQIDRLKAAFSEVDQAKDFTLYKEVKAAEAAMDRMREVLLRGFETGAENLQAKRIVERANGRATESKAQNAEIAAKENDAQLQTWDSAEKAAVVNASMSMKQAEDMVQRAFNSAEIREWFEGEYKNGLEWLKGEGAESVAMVIENEYALQAKYLNKIQAYLDEEITLEDILDAYAAGTLTGGVAKQGATRLDTAQRTGYSDGRFYAPKQLTRDSAIQIYDTANQKVTNANRAEVMQARANILFLAHDFHATELLGIPQAELNKKLRSWSRYGKSGLKISQRINAGVAPENRWTGIQNCSIINKQTVTDADILGMVKEIKGESNEYQRQYIARTMLALDTHIDWSRLTFLFKPGKLSGNARGLYSDEHITIGGNGYANTVAHEMGHALDDIWGRDVLGSRQKLTETVRSPEQIADPEMRQFFINFRAFMDSITDSADIRSSYTQEATETFARFVAKFVEFADHAAGNTFYQETNYYNDRFTSSQYIEFARLLQEKAMLDGKRAAAENGEAKAAQLQTWDAEYDAAVKSGNVEEQQRLVDEAAKAAGYTIKAFHGTRSFGFTVFDPTKADDGISLFATNSKKTAETYSGVTDRNRIKDRVTKNADDLHGEALIEEARTYNKRYNDYSLMSAKDKETVREDAKNSIGWSIRRAQEFVRDHKGAFDSEKSYIMDRLISSLYHLRDSETETDISKAWSEWEDAVWDLKGMDDSIALEFLDDVDSRGLFQSKNELDDMTYQGDMYADWYAGGPDYIFDNQLQIELNAEYHKGIYELLCKPGNQLEIDATGENWNQITPPKVLQDYGLYGPQMTRNIASAAKALGYDSVLLRGLRDNGGETAYNGISDVYIFFDANALKSADPVVYDDNGNVIPLSERFNESSDDIRYQTWSEGEVYNDRALVSEETLDKWMSSSWYGSSNPNYAQAFITSMSPSQFLKLTTIYDESRIRAESKDRTMEWAQDVSKSQPIQLHIDTETGQVVGHEGRHRMVVLEKNGIQEVPVLLFDSGNKYSKQTMKEYVLHGERFNGQYNVSRATVFDVYPLNQAHRTEIVDTYSKPTSLEKMQAKYQGKKTAQFQRWSDTSDDTDAERAGRQMAYARLQSENAILSQTVAELKKLTSKQDKTIAALHKRLQITKTPEVRQSDARKLAKRLLEENGSTTDVDSVAAAIKALGDYLLQTETSQISEEELKNRARSIAQDILENATDDFGAADETFTDIAGSIRGRSLSVDEDYLGDFDRLGGFEKFRRSLFGKLTLAKRASNTVESRDGYQSVDQFYTDMQAEFGKGYFPDVANEAEQVAILSQMLYASQPVQVNPYEQYMGEVTEELANRIVMDAMDGVLRPTPPTTADKQKARTKALQEQIKTLKAENKLADREAASLYHTIYDLSLALDKAESRYKSLQIGAADRIAQVRAEGAARAAEAKAAERERAAKQIAALKKHYADMRELARERREESANVTKYRKQIAQKAGKLYEMLMTNSDKMHVPEVLKAPLGEFLETIDFVTKAYPKYVKRSDGTLVGYVTINKNRIKVEAKSESEFRQKVDEIRAEIPPTKRSELFGARLMKLQQMLDNQQRYIDGDSNVQQDLGGYIDVSPEIMDYLRKMSEMITESMNMGRTFTINQMSAADLKVLSQFLSNLRAAINNMNRLMANARYQSVQEAASADINFMKSLGKAKESAESKLNSFAAWENGVPYYVFKRYGEGGRSIFDGFARGWERLAMNAQEIIDFTEKLYTTQEVRDWKSEQHDITLSDGSKVTMTTGQIMEFAMLLGRQQAVKHIAKGGIRIGNIKTGKGSINDTTHYHLTDADIQNIVGQLTDRQLEVAKALQQFMANKGAEWGNEISMRRFGYNFYNEGEGYYPIKTDSNDRPMADTDAQNNSMFRLLNLSASKTLNPKASNALIVNDIFDTFSDHMADMAKLNGMGLPILDAIKWFNYKERINHDDGTYDTRTLQGAMEQAFGSQAQKYFRTLMKDINGQSESGDRGMNLAGKLLSNYKAAAVGANLRVALLQPTSYVRAQTVLKPQYLAGAFFHRNAYKEAMKYSGTAVWKSLGYYETDISRGLREKIQHDDTLRDKTIEASMKPAEFGDQRTWGRLWVACKMQTKAENPGLEGEALNQATADLFREVIYSSQVMDSTLTRSEIMRGKGLYSKTSSAFMAEPTLSYNILLDAVNQNELDVRRYGKKAAWKKNAGRLAKAFTVYASSAVFSAIVESLADALRDDDDDELWQKFLQAFFGENKDGEIRFNLKGNLAQDLTILGKLPFIKNAISKLQGYSSGDMSMAGFINTINALEIWAETARLNYDRFPESVQKGMDLAGLDKLSSPTKITYYGNMTTWGKVYKTLQPLSQLSGLAAANLTRDVVAIWNNTVGAMLPEKKIKTYESKRDRVYRQQIAQTGVSKRKYDRILNDADTNGNGSLTQDELGAELKAAIKRGEITKAQADALWKAGGSNWKKTFSDWLEKNK